MGIARTLSKLSPPLLRLRILAFTAVVLIVPFTVYYLLYVKKQTVYFTDRSFRSIALTRRQIATKVESASGVLKNVGDKFVNPERKDDPRFDPTEPHKVNFDHLSNILKSIKEYSPEIFPIDVESKLKEKIDVTKPYKSAVTMEVRQEGGSPWLYFDYLYEPTDSSNQVRVQARTDLNKLILPLLSRPDMENMVDTDSEGFANILIAEAGTNGRVIFQQDTTELHLVSLDTLTSADNQEK